MVSPETDCDYWQRRAEEEVELARQASDPAVVAAHYRLSELYLDRLAKAGVDIGRSGQREH